MIRNILFVIFVFWAASPGYAQINSAKIRNYDLKLYERADFEIELTAYWENPYIQEQIALDMHIETPSGKQMSLPCFYKSGEAGERSLWGARFTAQESGEYVFYFSLSVEEQLISKSDTICAVSTGSEKKGFLKTKDNWVLQFDNGDLFRGIATNICWESRTKDDSKFFAELHERTDIYNYDYLLPKFAAGGGNFFRTWITSWNLPIDFQSNFNNSRYQNSESYYNESAVERMDKLLELADSLDLYIMLTLGMGNYTERDAGVVNTADDFFASSEAKQTYKNRLRYIVAMWGYSTSIAMWEFLNEVDNIQFNDREVPIDTEDIITWHQEMSEYLKQIDPYNHIVTTSISHRDIPGLNDIASIDVNQKHIYNNTNILSKEIETYTSAHDKPYIIGEFGYEWDWHKNFDDFYAQMEVDFKRGLWYGLFSSTPIIPMSWWWEYFENRGLFSYFKGVREINDKMLQEGRGVFITLDVKGGDLDVRAVQCKDHVYVYAYNPVGAKKNSIHISVSQKNTNVKAQSFEPTLQEYSDYSNIKVQDGKIILEDVFIAAEKEMIYIIKPN